MTLGQTLVSLTSSRVGERLSRRLFLADMSAEASATTLAAAAAASSSAKNSRCCSRGCSSQYYCRQGRHDLFEDTVNLQALRVFASYLPAGLVLRYAASADPRPPVEPEREDFEAVVCFLDISGFTALSEKLQKEHGQAGAELLTKLALTLTLTLTLTITLPLTPGRRGAAQQVHQRVL